MYIDLDKFNWWGLDHEKICKKFEGELSYCGTFCVLGNYNPVAVYKSKHPNLKKKHKKYMLLGKKTDMDSIMDKEIKSKWFVAGMTPSQMKKERKQIGVYCLECGDIIYSVNRHDYRHCHCKKSFVDGGKDYTRYNPDHTMLLEIDLITGEAEFKDE